MRTDELQRAIARILSASGARPPSLSALNEALKEFGNGSLEDFLTSRKAPKKRASARLQRPIDANKVEKWSTRILSFSGSVAQFRELLAEVQKLEVEEVRAIFNRVTGKKGGAISRPKAIEAMAQAYASKAVVGAHDGIAKRLFG